ncbi:DsbA family oxidoreductase [Miniphocaeibacter halophilus]|uniref:DsbA family oxidoreductase n=1 Tax=Miniphocaeibacter halophilus TaxID=2931922 RepID=A0AC61MSM1_9FIRM|nr:DsbA family oxidoreductase [Miniphocaeibacter halophilus]QQK08492.1 DsbA family oxidoreductase [Miniphocaeibacter halophilus]
MENKKITVDIFSDFTCPFCYMGKKNLYDAIDNLNARDIVEINYRAYELDENASKNESVLKYDYMQKQEPNKPLGIIMAETRDIIDQGKDLGLDFNYDIMLTGNTNAAHRLAKYSKTKGKEKEFINKVFEGYFTKGLNLNKEEELLKIIEEVGLNKEEAKKIIDSKDFSEEVAQDKYDAFQYQVQSVPFFLFDKRYGASGKQDVETFEEAIKKLADFNKIDLP